MEQAGDGFVTPDPPRGQGMGALAWVVWGGLGILFPPLGLFLVVYLAVKHGIRRAS